MRILEWVTELFRAVRVFMHFRVTTCLLLFFVCVFSFKLSAVAEEKIYISQDVVKIVDGKIVLETEEGAVCIDGVYCDEKGLYILQKPRQQLQEKARGGGPRGGHRNNARPSTRDKHEGADARRQREQQKAERKREEAKKSFK